MKTFLPFHKIGQQKVIVVDALHPHHLTLSHWKGANTIKSTAADTSGEIVLNAVEQRIDGIDCPNVTATHFDIDGFVGVFALFYPEIAISHKAILTAMATIGDFRTFNPNITEHHFALKLCCWMNKVEKDQFYRPFEAKDEIESCIEKFNYFLPIFPHVLKDINSYADDWAKEYEAVMDGLKQIQSVQNILEIGLQIKEVTKPIHYYALFSESDSFDIILSVYNENRYELEYKYITWVDITSRPSFPRLHLQPLVDYLNEIEESEYYWSSDHITDTGPILRLEKNKLSKAERYAHPFERTIYASSISKEIFCAIILKYFQDNYQTIRQKKYWSWAEMKAINTNFKS